MFAFARFQVPWYNRLGLRKLYAVNALGCARAARSGLSLLGSLGLGYTPIVERSRVVSQRESFAVLEFTRHSKVAQHDALLGSRLRCYEHVLGLDVTVTHLVAMHVQQALRHLQHVIAGLLSQRSAHLSIQEQLVLPRLVF